MAIGEKIRERRKALRLSQTELAQRCGFVSKTSFATFAARSGMDAYIVKRIMGHVVADITAGVYTHRSAEDLIREMTKFRPS